MITDLELRDLLLTKFPNWNLSINRSGVALWANLNDGDQNYFELQVTPSEGIGVSVIENTNSDMSGHDEVFDTIEIASDYLQSLIKG